MAADSLPSPARDAAIDDAPNSLPKSSNAFLERACSLNIGQADLKAHHESLIKYGDGEFMAKLETLPNQDESEETKAGGTC